MRRFAFMRLITSVTLVAFTFVYGINPRPALAATTLPSLNYELISWQARDPAQSGYITSGRTSGSIAELTTLQLENNRAAQAAGLSAQEVARVIESLPANTPMVFGRYAPGTGDLAIEIYKVERLYDPARGGHVTAVYRAPFTPQHGMLWAYARTYMEPAAKRTGTGIGANPFARFQSGSSPYFANASLEAAQVAVGHAMRFVGAPMGVLMVAVPRTEQEKKKSGNAFRKKITITVRGYLKPTFYIAAPAEFQPGGSSAAICVDASGNCTGKPWMVAPAMVTFQEWQGGTIPDIEDHVTTWSETKKGFTFLSFVVFAFVFAFAASAALTAVMAPTAAGGGGAAAGGLFTAGLQGLNIGAGLMSTITGVALTEAGLYAGLSWVLNGGSLTQIQNGYLGSVGDGTYEPQSDNSHPFEQQFVVDSRARVVTDDMLTGGLQGMRTYAVGNCPAGWTIRECQSRGWASGLVPRADSYIEVDATRLYQDTIQ